MAARSGQPQPPGPSALGLVPPAIGGPPAPGSSMLRPSPQRQSFFKMLSEIMISHNVPLPPTLTGIPNPNYDPSKSRFNMLEIPGEGCFRIAGKAIDVHELFGTVMTGFNGSNKLNQTNQWHRVVAQLGLPETATAPANPANNSGGQQVPTAALLPQYWRLILGPLEDMYFRQQQARASHAQMQLPGQPQGPGVGPGQPHGGEMMGPGGPSGPGPIPVMAPVGMNMVPQGGPAPMVGQKRKAEDELVQPNVRPPTPPILPTLARRHILPIEILKNPQNYVAPPLSAGNSTDPNAVEGGEEKYRYKIEYVPIARTLDTYGGRKLEDIDRQLADVQARRQVRAHDELGLVEIEGLTLSLASGLGPEISYALTTLTILSTLNGGPSAAPGGGVNVGFPLQKCEDLLDVIIDVLDDTAFGGEEEEDDESERNQAKDEPAERAIWTRAALIRQVDEETTEVLPRNKSATSTSAASSSRNGPHQPASAVILTILNLLRNLTGHEANPPFMASNPRLLDTLARICDVMPDDPMRSTTASPSAAPPKARTTVHRWRPLSAELSLPELLKIQQDTTGLIGMLDMQRMKLSNSHHIRKTTRRLYSLLVAPLIDQEEANTGRLAPRNAITYVGQSGGVIAAGGPGMPHINAHIDTALDAFAKLSVRDSNRIAFARAIPSSELMAHFEALVHMLPLTDADFDATTPPPTVASAAAAAAGGGPNMGAHSLAMETVIGYVERIMHCLHSLAFLAPPPLKQSLRKKHGRVLSSLCVHMAQYYLGGVRRSDGLVFMDGGAGGGRSGGGGNGWMVVLRRMYEMLSLLDLCEDAFDPVPATPLAFAPPPARAVESSSNGTSESPADNDDSKKDMRGLLSARFSEVLVTLLLRDTNDDVAFRELESLVRLGPIPVTTNT